MTPDQFAFSQRHLTIIVHMHDGRSIQEDFVPEAGGVLSEGDIAGFLQESSEGSTWEIMTETPTYITYLRKDGRATAQKAKPNIVTNAQANVKLTATGAELIIRYHARSCKIARKFLTIEPVNIEAIGWLPGISPAGALPLYFLTLQTRVIGPLLP